MKSVVNPFVRGLKEKEEEKGRLGKASKVVGRFLSAPLSIGARRSAFLLLNLFIVSLALLTLLYLARDKLQASKGFMKSPIDAICLIAMGDYVRTPLAPGAVSALQEHAPPGIPVFLVTDEPLCFINDPLFDSVQVIHVSALPKEATKLSRQLDAKSYKTRLFDLLPSPIEDVLYLDIDIRVTGSFSNWISELPILLPEDNNYTIALPRERVYADSPFNSGIIVMNRERSSKCLNEWRRLILSNIYDMDQKALEATGEVCQPLYLFEYAQTLLYMRDWFTGLFYELGVAGNVPMLHFTRSQEAFEETSVGCMGIWDCARLWMVKRVYMREDLRDQRQC